MLELLRRKPTIIRNIKKDNNGKYNGEKCPECKSHKTIRMRLIEGNIFKVFKCLKCGYKWEKLKVR